MAGGVPGGEVRRRRGSLDGDQGVDGGGEEGGLEGDVLVAKVGGLLLKAEGLVVMAGLDPATCARTIGVDGRVKPGHDDEAPGHDAANSASPRSSSSTRPLSGSAAMMSGTERPMAARWAAMRRKGRTSSGGGASIRTAGRGPPVRRR